MRIFFYVLSILPIKLAFLFLDIFFKFLPISFLRIFMPFKVTRKNLSIAFQNMAPLEIDLLAKESYKETIKSLYETLDTWSRPPKKIILKVKKINNRFLFNSSNHENGFHSSYSGFNHCAIFFLSKFFYEFIDRLEFNFFIKRCV